jgi:Big-like domain-containing protein
MTKAVRMALVFGSLALPLNGCSDNMGPPPPPPPPPPTGTFVSEPLPPASPAVPVVAAGTSATEVTYVSLAPGTAPGGRLAAIRNTRTGDTLSVPVGAGGFDPVAVPAATGDTLDIAVQLSDGGSLHFVEEVPLKRSPSVVRTYPSSGKRDVPLNTTLVVVFSQPIDPGTVTASTVQLRRGSTTVLGALALSDPEHVVFIPAAALAPSTLYTLVVTADVRDLEGDAVQEAFTAEFTTAATATGYEEYFVDAYLPAAAHQIGDSVAVDGVVRVMDGAGTGIERALIRFRGSVGRVDPDTTSAGLDGLVSVHWRFAGFIGILPPQATAELTACASNSVTRCDQSWSVVVIGFNPP